MYQLFRLVYMYHSFWQHDLKSEPHVIKNVSCLSAVKLNWLPNQLDIERVGSLKNKSKQAKTGELDMHVEKDHILL